MNDIKADSFWLSLRGLFAIFSTITLLWVVVLMAASDIRISQGFEDYLLLKSLAVQIFGTEAMGDFGVWHPFLLPALLLDLASKVSRQGPDYLMAHTLIWIPYFMIILKPLRDRLGGRGAAIFLGVSFVFINFPGAVGGAWEDVASFSLAIIYNRYLDVMWGAIFLVFFNEKKAGLFDALMIAFVLLVAWFSKLSYFAAFVVALSPLVLVKKQYVYLFPIVIVTILGGAYETIGGLVNTNYEMLLARKGKRELGTIFKFRTVIPGILLPIYMLSRQGEGKYSGFDIFGMIFLSGLVAGVQLGNHGDMAGVPFAYLVFFVLYKYRILFLNREFFWDSKRKSSLGFVFFSVSIACFSIICFVQPLVKAVIPVVVFVRDQLVKDEWIGLEYIPGFVIKKSRYDYSARLAAEGKELPTDYKMFQVGERYSSLIGFLRGRDKEVYFLEAFPSLFPIQAANQFYAKSARAWINSIEFADYGDRYKKQQENLADWVIYPDCAHRAGRGEYKVDGTCFVLRPGGAVQ